METQVTIAENKNTPDVERPVAPSRDDPPALRGAVFGVPFMTRAAGKRFFVQLDRHAFASAWSYPLRNLLWQFGQVEYTPALDRMLDETIASLTALRAQARSARASRSNS